MYRPLGVACARLGAMPRRCAQWLSRIDPDARRRIRGIRLVATSLLALLLAKSVAPVVATSMATPLVLLASVFALWAGAQETGRPCRASIRELVGLCVAATVGAACASALGGEWTLVFGAMLAGGLRGRGALAAAMGSQFFIGQMLACALALTPAAMPLILLAGGLATLAAAATRFVTGDHEPAAAPAKRAARTDAESSAWEMAWQAALPAGALIVLDHVHGLVQPEWAIAAAVYVVASTRSETWSRCRRRVGGTAVGVCLALLLLCACHVSMLLWAAAAIALVVYAVAVPARYDVACGACSFALVCLLGATGQHSLALMVARIWETGLGGALGLLAVISVRRRRRPRALR